MALKRLYLDSETIGFTGPVVLIQYAIGVDGEVIIHDFWKSTVDENIALIDMILEYRVVAFNLVFDWFHLVKAYNVLKVYKERHGGDCQLDRVKYWEIDRENPSSWCLKPKGAFDIMLWCQRNEFQWLMDRKNIHIRKIPKELAVGLYTELKTRIVLRPALNATWKLEVFKNRDGELDNKFYNVKLVFRPSKSLDTIALDVLGVGKAPSFIKDLPKPEETPWRPYGGGWCHDTYEKKGKKGLVFDAWVDFWEKDEGARFYAKRDVELLQQLDEKFGFPEETVDDRLAILVSNVRWRGYSVDVNMVNKILKDQEAKVKDFPININSPKQVLEYIRKDLSPIEAMALTSTNKVIMEKLAKDGNEFANDILLGRQARSVIRLFEKFTNGKFHASLKVIGALSGRMSGADKLNPHGINRNLRHPFTMAYKGKQWCPSTKTWFFEILSGGDFDAFEVSIADAVYDDPKLRELLMSGKKVHGVFGEQITGQSYDRILLTKEGICPDCVGTGYFGSVEAVDESDYTKEELNVLYEGREKCENCSGSGVDNSYTNAKSGFFGFIYGAQEQKLGETLKIDTEDALDGLERLKRQFPGIARAQQRIFEKFCSMRQPVAYGKVEWHEPDDNIETLLGFKRWFNLENRICKAIYDLAESPPKEWRKFKVKNVSRREGRIQTAMGAVQSALFGAAFGIQALNMRAAGNHEIQGTGAGLNKELQDDVWVLQPTGAHGWYVRPMNVHDELQIVHRKGMGKKIQKIKEKFVTRRKQLIALLAMDWTIDSPNWAGSH